MKLAILHYHLNRGGVTRVIENQLLALDSVLEPDSPWQVVLIYGGRRKGWAEDLPQRLKAIHLTLHEAPLLEYDSERGGGDISSECQAEQLTELLTQLGFTPQETVVHVHNHAVGKSVALPGTLCLLAQRGYALLLQIHDFAEDLRPGNFRRLCDALAGDTPGGAWHGRLYPQASHVHYAVLNGRDHEILRGAGTDADRVHLLPNPVPKMSQPVDREAARRRLRQRFGVTDKDRFVLYPVRCIRRKNLGEVLLYSQLAAPGTVVGLTLAPLNPAEQPVYNAWKHLAAELKLPSLFEVGATGGLSFAENLAAADMILTTSVAEGFGMVFLESWLAGRVLMGRDLPEITVDFCRVGVRLDWLRPRLQVPGEWVGMDRFRETVLNAYRRTLAAYDRPQPPDLGERLDAKSEDGLVDFADLDERLQQEVIRKVSGQPSSRRRVLESNPWIDEAFSLAAVESSDLIRQNAEVIDGHFSLAPSGRRLFDAYRRVKSSGRSEGPRPLDHADRILDGFLDLGRFRPIRS